MCVCVCVCVLSLTVTTKLVKNYYISLNYHSLAKLRSKSCWVVGTFKPYLLVKFLLNFMHSQVGEHKIFHIFFTSQELALVPTLAVALTFLRGWDTEPNNLVSA